MGSISSQGNEIFVFPRSGNNAMPPEFDEKRKVRNGSRERNGVS